MVLVCLPSLLNQRVCEKRFASLPNKTRKRVTLEYVEPLCGAETGHPDIYTFSVWHPTLLDLSAFDYFIIQENIFTCRLASVISFQIANPIFEAEWYCVFNTSATLSAARKKHLLVWIPLATKVHPRVLREAGLFKLASSHGKTLRRQMQVSQRDNRQALHRAREIIKHKAYTAPVSHTLQLKYNTCVSFA